MVAWLCYSMIRNGLFGLILKSLVCVKSVYFSGLKNLTLVRLGFCLRVSCLHAVELFGTMNETISKSVEKLQTSSPVCV